MTKSLSHRPLGWFDALKGLAMLWVVLNHIVEQMFGGEYLGNPSVAWPPLTNRIAQFFTPLGNDWFGTIVRDVGWLGDQGVSVFIVASGFGIAYGLECRGTGRIDLGAYVRARADRVYPLWLAVHGVVLVMLFLTWAHPTLSFVLSVLGVRFTPATMYLFVPAWWYAGLLLQLYAIVPLLWYASRRFGMARTFVVTAVASLIIRGIGLFVLHGYVDEWSRGAIFVTRLPEFVFGMSAALWYVRDGARVASVLRTPAVWVGLTSLFVLGLAASFTLVGMTVAPFLMGSSAFVAFGMATQGDRKAGALAWAGRHSYALYLVHQVAIDTLVPRGTAVSAVRIVCGVVAALGVSVVAALALEAGVRALQRMPARYAHGRTLFALRDGALTFASAYAMLVLCDVAVLRFAPPETNGWGERPALVPDDRFGWKLAPSKTTHLRWLSYDYTVRSNALGYPGRDVALQKPAGTFRVLVTGDAFTSGEGVGTSGAWPVLLQSDLARRMHRRVQVFNFGMTGYGPDQEARIVEHFTPLYEPDVVIFESFVNAFEKLHDTDESTRADIGFGRAAGDGVSAIVHLAHLRPFLSDAAGRLSDELVNDEPDKLDYQLSDGSAFVRGDPYVSGEIAAYRARVWAARAAALARGARFMLVMIPSRVQVCVASDFFPGAFLDLKAPQFDKDRPQREAARIASSMNVPFVDLRPALGAGGCPYQPENMHFLASGQARAARAVAAALVENLAQPNTVHRITPGVPRSSRVHLRGTSGLDVAIGWAYLYDQSLGDNE